MDKQLVKLTVVWLTVFAITATSSPDIYLLSEIDLDKSIHSEIKEDNVLANLKKNGIHTELLPSKSIKRNNYILWNIPLENDTLAKLYITIIENRKKTKIKLRNIVFNTENLENQIFYTQGFVRQNGSDYRSLKDYYGEKLSTFIFNIVDDQHLISESNLHKSIHLEIMKDNFLANLNKNGISTELLQIKSSNRSNYILRNIPLERDTLNKLYITIKENHKKLKIKLGKIVFDDDLGRRCDSRKSRHYYEEKLSTFFFDIAMTSESIQRLN